MIDIGHNKALRGIELEDFFSIPEFIFSFHVPVEHHLHIIPHVRVPVLIDGEAGRGMQQLDVHDPYLQK